MHILALDASTDWCSVALGGEQGFKERIQRAGQRHSELMLPLAGELLSEQHASIADLDGIAFGAGPGSFTGLRIACGLAQGIAMGAGLPVVGIGTLLAMAELAHRRHGAARVMAALDARMHEVYVAAYERDGECWREALAPMVVKPIDAPLPPGTGWLAAGAGFSQYAALRSRLAGIVAGFADDIVPSASIIGALSLPRFATGEGLPARDAAPVYIRQRVAVTTAERAAGMVL